MFSHLVQFYDSDAFLVQTVLEFVRPAQQAGDGAIVVATREHLNLLQAMMGSAPGGVQRDGADRCVFLDARETLATFMLDGLPDEQRFTDVVGGLVRQVSNHGGRHVSVFGEMVAVLYAEGNAEAAVRLEQLWEQLARQHRFKLLCAYPLAAFPDDGHRHAFECICAAHSHVNPIERLGAARSEPQALHRTIALLQQRADGLDIELRRREDCERALKEQAARLAVMASALAALESLAGEDALTGLCNRRIFSDRLAHAVERAARTGHPLALIYIDLDDFKAQNDSHGHAAGDQLLKQVAARLGLCVRSADTVCRWGGDEFAVIAEDADAAEAAVLVQRIAAAFGEAFALADASIDLSASVGFSLYPDDAADAQSLLRSADAAMYRAKRFANGCDGEAPASAAPVALARKAHARALPHGVDVPALLTIEAAADMLHLSRPHVFKLIAERRFHDVAWLHAGAPLIPALEVSRVAQENSRSADGDTGASQPVRAVQDGGERSVPRL